MYKNGLQWPLADHCLPDPSFHLGRSSLPASPYLGAGAPRFQGDARQQTCCLGKTAGGKKDKKIFVGYKKPPRAFHSPVMREGLTSPPYVYTRWDMTLKKVICLRTLSTAHDIKYQRSASTRSSPTLPLQNKTIRRERKQTELFTLAHFFLLITMKSPAKILAGRLLPKGNAAQELLAQNHRFFLQVSQPW